MRDEAWFKEHPEVDRYEYHRGASGSWYESFIDTRNHNLVISSGGHPAPCPPLLAPDVGGYFDALIANGMPIEPGVPPGRVAMLGDVPIEIRESPQPTEADLAEMAKIDPRLFKVGTPGPVKFREFT